MSNDTETHRNAFPLVYAIAEQVSLPMAEIVRQIQSGLCQVNGHTIHDPWFLIIMGCRVALGQTVNFSVGVEKEQKP